MARRITNIPVQYTPLWRASSKHPHEPADQQQTGRLAHECYC